DPRHTRVNVDLEDTVHLGGDDHDRVVERCSATGEPGARATRDERPAVATGHPHARLHLRGRGREAHDAGPALDVRRVPPVEADLGATRVHAYGPEGGPEVGDEGVAGHALTLDVAMPPSRPGCATSSAATTPAACRRGPA